MASTPVNSSVPKIQSQTQYEAFSVTKSYFRAITKCDTDVKSIAALVSAIVFPIFLIITTFTLISDIVLACANCFKSSPAIVTPPPGSSTASASATTPSGHASAVTANATAPTLAATTSVSTPTKLADSASAQPAPASTVAATPATVTTGSSSGSSNAVQNNSQHPPAAPKLDSSTTFAPTRQALNPTAPSQMKPAAPASAEIPVAAATSSGPHPAASALTSTPSDSSQSSNPPRLVTILIGSTTGSSTLTTEIVAASALNMAPAAGAINPAPSPQTPPPANQNSLSAAAIKALVSQQLPSPQDLTHSQSVSSSQQHQTTTDDSRLTPSTVATEPTVAQLVELRDLSLNARLPTPPAPGAQGFEENFLAPVSAVAARLLDTDANGQPVLNTPALSGPVGALNFPAPPPPTQLTQASFADVVTHEPAVPAPKAAAANTHTASAVSEKPVEDARSRRPSLAQIKEAPVVAASSAASSSSGRNNRAATTPSPTRQPSRKNNNSRANGAGSSTSSSQAASTRPSAQARSGGNSPEQSLPERQILAKDNLLAAQQQLSEANEELKSAQNLSQKNKRNNRNDKIRVAEGKVAQATNEVARIEALLLKLQSAE